MPLTAETVLLANRSEYSPRALPAAFNQIAGTGSGLGVPAPAPDPVFDSRQRPGGMELRVPPAVDPEPYRIGVGDVILLATPNPGNTVEQLSGLLAAQNARQGYTVQDDGAIAIPTVGRVEIAGMTLEEAEAQLFQSLVSNQIDPTFSLEISAFNSKKVSVGGAVGSPRVVPITLTPLYLEEALAQAGGITVNDQDYASVRIYRDGTLYQIPLTELYARDSLRRVPLLDGDAVFVDTAYDLELARGYFEEQIRLATFKQTSRQSALSQLNSEIGIRRAALNEQRALFNSRLGLGAEQRDYVYLTGEVRTPGRYPLPYERSAVLADALYEQGGGISALSGDVRQIYVLRGASDPREFGALTAWKLNVANAANFLLATKFELRPNDVIFIAEQPVTRWNRTIRQILPTLNVTNTAGNLTD
ncbi:sugar transporter [Pseudooceanicola sediminis]|uniref:Sugar transporter n=1 Tax=Pseudooceanicola sediminis TaxID=2211117 RepID=A0A399IVJ8_9RHOB|nr:sugar transporter [Puniceibacterium sp. HSS470]RII37153.1 sugar transporter [Pseudooceanicola sediminis]